jgi:hypothetical protein
MKSLGIFVNFIGEINPMRRTADGTEDEGRVCEKARREFEADTGALQAMA